MKQTKYCLKQCAINLFGEEDELDWADHLSCAFFFLAGVGIGIRLFWLPLLDR